MEVRNQPAVWHLIERVRNEVPNKSIWVYSGYTYEELTDSNNARTRTDVTDNILDNIDILVDGEFVLDLKNISLKFRGSSNQRIIDMKATRESNEIILSDYMV